MMHGEHRREATSPVPGASLAEAIRPLIVIVGRQLAVVLAVAVFVVGTRGTLTPRVGVLLLTLAMLAAVVALLHMLAR